MGTRPNRCSADANALPDRGFRWAYSERSRSQQLGQPAAVDHGEPPSGPGWGLPCQACACPSSARPDRSANACGVRVTAYVAKYIWRTDPSSRGRPRAARRARGPGRPGTGRRPRARTASRPARRRRGAAPTAGRRAPPGRAPGPRTTSCRGARRGRAAAARASTARARAGSASSTAVTSCVASATVSAPAELLLNTTAPTPSARRTRRPGEEARHRAAVPGQHPLPDALQVEAQPVGAAPAVDVGHDQRPAHLLDRVGAEHLGHRVGDEAGVAAQVGDGAPQPAEGGGGAQVEPRLERDGAGVRVHEVARGRGRPRRGPARCAASPAGRGSAR